jgi:hypothetical protein
MRRTLLTVALSILVAGPASAQQPLKISFEDGRVSIDATSVPVRTILNEWAKIGGTNVVGAERVSGAPITVKLVNIPEAQALETILRSVAGYMAAPRNMGTGRSMYDRILVMATTSAPATASAVRPAPQPSTAFAGTQRFVPPRPPQRQDQPEQDEPAEPDENPPSPPVFTFPQGGQPGQFVNAPQGQSGEPQTITITPAQNGPGQRNVPGQMNVPVGVSQPGMMVPAPQPVRPPNGPGMIRPPGGN